MRRKKKRKKYKTSVPRYYTSGRTTKTIILRDLARARVLTPPTARKTDGFKVQTGFNALRLDENIIRCV